MQMKKLKNTIVLLACLTFSPAFARLLENGALDQINNSVAVDVTGLNLKYWEYFSPSMGDSSKSKSTEAGTIVGFFLNVRKAIIEKIYTDLSFDYYSGKLKYDGIYQKTYLPLATKFQHKIFNADLKTGYIFTFTESNSFQIIPYVGVGYRYWNRQSDNFYNEKYQHYKAVVGMKCNWLLTDDFVLSPYIEGGKIFSANAKEPYYGWSYILGKKPIYEAGLEANYKLFDEFFLNGFASYTQFKYGRSEYQYKTIDDTIWRFCEPDSKTNEIKFGFGVRYSWMIN
ncbi:conserved exported hypothetical protein [Gammaproteobacteria bacterium]